MDSYGTSSSNFESEFMESENRLKNIDGRRPHPRKGNGIRKMYLAALCSLLIALSSGLITGYSAPATYDMVSSPGSAVKPNEKEVMWIGSIPGLGVIAGGIIAGPLADKIGRKDTLVYNILPTGFGWLIICYAESVPVILLGRLLGGVALGVLCVAVPMYCVEIATAEVRGILGSLFQGFLVMGNLLSVTVGAYLSWNYLALHGAIISVLAVMVFCLAPETPRWYLMKNDLKSAIYVMDKLQGGFVDSKAECEAIYEDLKNQPKGKVTLEELRHPTVIKPALITFVVMFFQAFCGMNAVFLYSSSIFEVSKDFIDPKVATIILGAVQVFATLISNFVVDKLGRKILLIVSGGVIAASFAVFGIFYYKTSQDVGIQIKYGWIPLTCCITSVIGYSAGYGPIPFLLSAEMLPIRVRSTVSSAVHVCNGLFNFIVTNTLTDLENAIHNYGAFWFYSSMSVLSIVFVIFFVPETKGKPLEEIQNFFIKKPKTQKINISVMS